MFEIIPNWHPVFVHFTVSTLSLAVVFYCLAYALRNKASYVTVKTFADWNLWLGSGFSVVTAIAGWLAYNSVAHDGPSHAAMTDHRNWALAALALFVVIAIWAFFRNRSDKIINIGFTIITLIAFLLLASAAWRGGEAVYRYGLGVMSLPLVEEGQDGHNHEHAEGAEHGHSTLSDDLPMTKDIDVNKSTHHEDLHNNDGHKH